MEKQQPINPTDTISWEAYEYEPKDRGRDWFWGVGIITLALALSSAILGNLLFAGVIILAALVLTLYAIREPRLVTFTIVQEGILIDNKKHPYKIMHSFGIENGEEEKNKLIIQSKNLLSPYLIIPIENVDTTTIRALLLNFLPEKEHREPISHKLLEQLGF